MWRSVAMVVAAGGLAIAQPVVETEPPPIDPAWAAYDEAYDAAAGGEPARAAEQLSALTADYPGHPAAGRAGQLLRARQPDVRDPNAPSKLARGELAFWSTLSGVSVGLNTCVLLDCSSDRAYAGVYMLTVGGSLGASLLLTRDGIRQGQTQLYNAAQTWGAWNGLAINDGFARTRAEAGTALAAHAIGLGAGLALWETWRPSEGDVALTNTFWVWSSVMTVWAHLAADSDSLSLRRVVLVGDLGLVAGALASTQIQMSRGRTFLIDVGGVLGVLAGGLVAAGTDGRSTGGTALLLGTAGGLAAGVALSSDWDAPKLPVSPAPIAGAQSVGIGLATSGTW